MRVRKPQIPASHKIHLFGLTHEAERDASYSTGWHRAEQYDAPDQRQKDTAPEPPWEPAS